MATKKTTKKKAAPKKVVPKKKTNTPAAKKTGRGAMVMIDEETDGVSISVINSGLQAFEFAGALMQAVYNILSNQKPCN